MSIIEYVSFIKRRLSSFATVHQLWYKDVCEHHNIGEQMKEKFKQPKNRKQNENNVKIYY